MLRCARCLHSAHPNQVIMDYSPDTMALITSDCDAMRSPSIEWP